MQYRVLPDMLTQLNDRYKEHNLDISRCTSIQKALNIGIGLCGDNIAENIYPLQRDLKQQKLSLSKSITEISKAKMQQMRMY